MVKSKHPQNTVAAKSSNSIFNLISLGAILALGITTVDFLLKREQVREWLADGNTRHKLFTISQKSNLVCNKSFWDLYDHITIQEFLNACQPCSYQKFSSQNALLNTRLKEVLNQRNLLEHKKFLNYVLGKKMGFYHMESANLPSFERWKLVDVIKYLRNHEAFVTTGGKYHSPKHGFLRFNFADKSFVIVQTQKRYVTKHSCPMKYPGGKTVSSVKFRSFDDTPTIWNDNMGKVEHDKDKEWLCGSKKYLECGRLRRL